MWLAGCSGSDDTPKPKPRAVFDQQDAESTFRWLIAEAKPVGISGELSRKERMNNPLRKDYHDRYQQDLQRWNEMLGKLVGTKVVWLTQVAWISEQNVEVDCLPRELREDGTKVSVNFADCPQYRIDHQATASSSWAGASRWKRPAPGPWLRTCGCMG